MLSLKPDLQQVKGIVSSNRFSSLNAFSGTGRLSQQNDTHQLTESAPEILAHL